MTDKTKEFLTELHKLLDKYKVEFEAVEKTRFYETYCSGINITVGLP